MAMFLPVKYQTNQSALVNCEMTVCPISHLDVNAAGMVDSSKTVDITDQDGQYKQSIFLKISRTPLSNGDPNTYIAFPPDFQPNKSKMFVEYDFQLPDNDDEKKSADNKSSSSINNGNGTKSSSKSNDKNASSQSSSEGNPTTATSASSATDKKPFGANLNALAPDPFKFVHLTPGCDNHYVSLHIPPKDSSAFYSDRLYVDNSDLKSPKTAITRNSSTFLSKAIPVEGMHKKINHSDSVIYNCHGKVFNMYSLKNKCRRNTSSKNEEVIDQHPLLRMVFTKTISCMDSVITGTSKAELKFDILIGFTSGDIFWYDPFLNKYSRFNKNGKLTKNMPLISLKWLHDGKHFLAGFSDGSLLLFNRNLDEDENHFFKCMKNAIYNANSQQTKKFLRVLKSIETADINPIGHYKMSSSPVTSIIQFPITNSLLFESLRNTLCITFDDGFARIFDLGNEVVSTVLPSSFSGIFSSCWSPDGKFLALAGQDDLINMFEVSPYSSNSHGYGGNNITSPASSITTGASPRSVSYGNISSSASTSSFNSANSNPHLLTTTTSTSTKSLSIKLVARLQGHYAWVRSVKFDYLKCPPKFIASPINYRISSVGDDGKLIFWDFSPKTISKSKLRQSHSNTMGYNNSNSNINTGKAQQVKSRNRRNTKTSINSNASIIGMTTNSQQDQPTKKLEQALQVTKGVPVTDEPTNKAECIDSENRVASNSINETSITKNAIIHDLLSNKKVGIIQPLTSIDLNFGRLSNVQYTNDGVWVTAAGGDIRKFKRPLCN